MISANKDDSATDAMDSVESVSQLFRAPLFWPQGIKPWFIALEAQFGAARITGDKTKYTMTVANIEP